MKAVILAGGSGTRGRPYTEYFPKAMIPVGGRPLIDHIVRYLRSAEIIGEIVIVSDFGGLGGQIQNYYEGADGGDGMTFVQDSQSGTGGDLLHAAPALRGEEEFLLWFADNLCAFDVAGMREQLRRTGSLACIATRTRRREETGFAEIGDGGMIRRFREKPVMRLQMAECLGAYVLGGGVIGRIRKARMEGQGGGRRRRGGEDINLSYDILQPMSGEARVCAYDIGDADWIDVGSPVTLDRNRSTVRRIMRQMGL